MASASRGASGLGTATRALVPFPYPAPYLGAPIPRGAPHEVLASGSGGRGDAPQEDQGLLASCSGGSGGIKQEAQETLASGSGGSGGLPQQQWVIEVHVFGRNWMDEPPDAAIVCHCRDFYRSQDRRIHELDGADGRNVRLIMLVATHWHVKRWMRREKPRIYSAFADTIQHGSPPRLHLFFGSGRIASDFYVFNAGSPLSSTGTAISSN